MILMDGQKKLTIDFKTPDSLYLLARSSNGLVTMSSNRNLDSLYQRNLTKLKKLELIDFVEFCLEKYEVEHRYSLDTENCGSFLRAAVSTLREKGKISETKIEIFAKKLNDISVSVSQESNKHNNDIEFRKEPISSSNQSKTKAGERKYSIRQQMSLKVL